MAERRMFAKSIIDSDAFLDMPLSAQCLYFHLSMRADDEGFLNNHKKIQRMIGASDDDMKVLLAKNFVIAFESGVIVIKHWKIHNYIRSDRLAKTNYEDERSLLKVKENGAYTFIDELAEIEDLSARDKRKKAYQESSLPYSFEYKIKRAFCGKKCPVCGVEMSSAYKLTMPTIQHNIPISKGGKHELENISIICESCNTSIRDKETESLNNLEVIELWDKIVEADKQKIKWFFNPELLMSVECQTNDGQVTGKCQHRLGKDSIDKDNKNIITNILPSNDKTIFITIPLNDKTEYPVYDDDVEEYKSLYPAVDVEQQLRNMKGWCDANPSKRKTSKGIKRFITSWLCREQDRGGTKQEPRRGFDANKGIMSSGYDFAELEAEVKNRR